MPSFSVAAFLFAALAASLLAGTEPIIAKARAYLGPESKLDSITSIHYVGTLSTQQTGKDKEGHEIARPFTASVDIVFQKPYRQWVKLVWPNRTEITALDGYEAWRRSDDPADDSHWTIMLLGKEQVKTQRANTWENLAFFRGIESLGGYVEDLGRQAIDGHDCEKLAFVHEPGIAFYRYFDKATGQLRLTELENGYLFREKGEMIVDGIRFPKTLLNITKDPATGRESITAITIDKITLNEVFPDSLFAVPMVTSK